MKRYSEAVWAQALSPGPCHLYCAHCWHFCLHIYTRINVIVRPTVYHWRCAINAVIFQFHDSNFIKHISVIDRINEDVCLMPVSFNTSSIYSSSNIWCNCENKLINVFRVCAVTRDFGVGQYVPAWKTNIKTSYKTDRQSDRNTHIHTHTHTHPQTDHATPSVATALISYIACGVA